jgi:GNAT superfamily N-acetyltransferase
MGELEIRVATSGDRDMILAFLCSAAVWLRERGVDYWQNWLDPPEHHVAWVEDGLVAGEFRIVESGSRSVGCLRLQDSDELFWGTRSEPAGYVHSLTTDRSLAGLGVGRRILDFVSEELRLHGIGLLRLDCGVDADGLRRYYESCGFVAVGETVVDGEALVLYEKSIVVADR